MRTTALSHFGRWHEVHPRARCGVSFKVGDIAIGQNFLAYPELNGMECVLLEFDYDAFAIMAATNKPIKGPMWLVKWQDGRLSWQDEQQLRKKDEPKADFTPGDWDLCPFQPYRERERV